jgi:hypothetical protein
MSKNKILLSTGSILWMGIKQATNFAKQAGYDGIEVVPTNKLINENIENYDWSFIDGLHHNWRMDIGQDNKYAIDKFTSLLFTLLRLIFFPKINSSKIFIQHISTKYKLPVTIHNITPEWTKDNENVEFKGGINLEIIGTSIPLEELKKWLKDNHHNISIDSRDDQSLIWAKKYGFNSWQYFWKWLRLEKIKNYQLTFIGNRTLRQIMKHEISLPEEQLLWFYENNWKGNIIVEVNPLMLFFLCKGNIKNGFKIISKFVRQTLVEGKKWS